MLTCLQPSQFCTFHWFTLYIWICVLEYKWINTLVEYQVEFAMFAWAPWLTLGWCPWWRFQTRVAAGGKLWEWEQLGAPAGTDTKLGLQVFPTDQITITTLGHSTNVHLLFASAHQSGLAHPCGNWPTSWPSPAPERIRRQTPAQPCLMCTSRCQGPGSSCYGRPSCCWPFGPEHQETIAALDWVTNSSLYCI